MLGAWIMELLIYMFNLIMATHYPTSAKTKEIYRSDGMNNCLIDICNLWLFSLGWCGLCWRSIVCISCINYQGLFSFFFPTWSTWYLNLEYMISDFWRSCCIALHCTALHGIWSYVANLWHLGITMQLHTLSGMKAEVHMYPYAYSIIGLV